jgi:hypothetical protein
MAGITSKSFSSPDEVRSPDKTKVDVIDLGAAKAAKISLQPGWRWSDCVKPVVGGDSCQARHVGTVVSGQLHVEHTDGSTADIGAGEAYIIEPGHDAWVIGDEACVSFEFESTTSNLSKHTRPRVAPNRPHPRRRDRPDVLALRGRDRGETVLFIAVDHHLGLEPSDRRGQRHDLDDGRVRIQDPLRSDDDRGVHEPRLPALRCAEIEVHDVTRGQHRAKPSHRP